MPISSKENNTIFLYLKIHNKTHQKYLGKTIKNPFLYNGSGIYWKNHLKKHGKDISTYILFQSTNLHNIKVVGLYYSKLWNIVENKSFSNLIEEYGSGGKTKTSFKKGMQPSNKGKKASSDTRKRMSEGRKKYFEEWRKRNSNYRSKWKKYQCKGRVDNTSKLNIIILQCPHCDKKGNLGNMKRWHFDRCKFK
jgi:hypothetical protein